MKDNLGGVRYLIDRLGLPPRMKVLVADIENEAGINLSDPPAVGAAEVKQILGMVDGPWLLASIVAAILSTLDLEQPDDIETAKEPDLSGADAGPDGSPPPDDALDIPLDPAGAADGEPEGQAAPQPEGTEAPASAEGEGAADQSQPGAQPGEDAALTE